MRKIALPKFSIAKLDSLYSGWFPQEDDSQRIYYIQGKRASLNEYNEAAALETLQLDYIFQLALMGGRMMAFGIILDFLVETVPRPTPMWVNGEYWHRGAQLERDLYQMSLIEEYLGGEVMPPVVLWGDQTDTEEKALMYTKIALGYVT